MQQTILDSWQVQRKLRVTNMQQITWRKNNLVEILGRRNRICRLPTVLFTTFACNSFDEIASFWCTCMPAHGTSHTVQAVERKKTKTNDFCRQTVWENRRCPLKCSKHPYLLQLQQPHQRCTPNNRRDTDARNRNRRKRYNKYVYAKTSSEITSKPFVGRTLCLPSGACRHNWHNRLGLVPTVPLRS